MADALSFYGAKSGAPKAVLVRALDKYMQDKSGDVRFLGREVKKLAGEDKVLKDMVALISKKVCEEIISEDAVEMCLAILQERKEYKNRPDLADTFQEACGIVEEKVRQALGVKCGKKA